jgi:thermitase
MKTFQGGIMKIRNLLGRRGALASAAGVALLLSAQPIMASGYIVKFKEGTNSFKNATSQKSLNGSRITDKHAAGNFVVVNVDSSNKSTAAARLAELMMNPDVQYVVENIKIHAFDMPNDPDTSKQWSIAKVRAADAWTSGTGSRDIVVAITDTGVDYTHSDIAANVWTNKGEIPGNNIDDDNNGFVDDIHGYDFRDNDSDPMDVTGDKNPGHGTHCAGIIGAVGDNGVGISGMSQRVSLMASRFIGADGSGDLAGAVKSIDYAISSGANIISASWGAPVSADGAKPITEAIGRANDKGVIFVAAASNDGKNNDGFEVYPANTPLPNVITVAASGSSDAKPSWSNFGIAKVSLAAPGEGIYSTLPSNKYGNLSGTSMAAPLVAGLVAVMLSHDKNLTAPQVKALLQASGEKVSIETACECRIDAGAVVSRIDATTLTVVPQAATIAPNSTLQFSTFGGRAPFKFSSSADSIGSITTDGLLTAKGTGEVNITVVDADNVTNQSLRIRIVEGSGGGGGGGGGEECPLDPALCAIMCQLEPTLPWCAK